MNWRTKTVISTVVGVCALNLGCELLVAQMSPVKTRSVKPTLTIVTTKDVGVVHFSPDDKWLVTAGAEAPAQVRAVATGKVVSQLKDSQETYEVTFSPRGKMIFGLRGAGNIVLWDVVTGQQLASFKGHHNKVPARGVAYDPVTGKSYYPLTGGTQLADILVTEVSRDEKLLATGSDDKTVELWSIPLHKKLRVFNAHKAEINGIAFSPDGKIIASSDRSGIAKVWESSTGRVAGTIRVGTENEMLWMPDGKAIRVTTPQGKVTLWDAKTLRVKATFISPAKKRAPIQTNPTQIVSYSADGSRMAVAEALADLSHRDGGVVGVYKVQSGKLLYGLQTAKPYNCALSSNGKLLAVCGVDYNHKTKPGFRRVIQIWKLL